jgi:hypothetical protein
MNRIQFSRYNKAVHEAGHAVAADELGIEIDYVTIKPQIFDGISGGYVHFNEDERPSYRAMFIMYWAGICAERIHRPRCTWKSLIEGTGAQDMVEITQASVDTMSLGMTAVEFTKKHFAKDTTDLLRRRWKDVLKVAEALCEHETLSGADVNWLLRRREQEEAA